MKHRADDRARKNAGPGLRALRSSNEDDLGRRFRRFAGAHGGDPQRAPDVRAELDRRFQYVLVDEYQDTNLAQYAIVRAISNEHPNLCVTGDPDQSIYGWRGANLSNILEFEHDFPGCRVVTLERNYRSTKNIISVADHLIRFNRNRKPKALKTENPSGDPVELTHLPARKRRGGRDRRQDRRPGSPRASMGLPISPYSAA